MRSVRRHEATRQIGWEIATNADPTASVPNPLALVPTPELLFALWPEHFGLSMLPAGHPNLAAASQSWQSSWEPLPCCLTNTAGGTELERRRHGGLIHRRRAQ